MWHYSELTHFNSLCAGESAKFCGLKCDWIKKNKKQIWILLSLVLIFSTGRVRGLCDAFFETVTLNGFFIFGIFAYWLSKSEEAMISHIHLLWYWSIVSYRFMIIIQREVFDIVCTLRCYCLIISSWSCDTLWSHHFMQMTLTSFRPQMLHCQFHYSFQVIQTKNNINSIWSNGRHMKDRWRPKGKAFCLRKKKYWSS